MKIEAVLPSQIETRSFEIIEEELKGVWIDPVHKPVLKRVIHTTADFDYVENLIFSEHSVERAVEALQSGSVIVTDTQMAGAGIHKASMHRLGGETVCFIQDEEVARLSKERGCTRSAVSMEKAAEQYPDAIYAIGNAPTALIRLHELIQEGKARPKLVIGAPVGFVNVVASKELFLNSEQCSIIAKGRKGGSNVAAAICNALIYMATGER